MSAQVAGGYGAEPARRAAAPGALVGALPAPVAVALASAGEVTNPAGTARLKEYWTTGKGAQEIVHWGTPGDFMRCVRALRKYVDKPGEAEGFCASAHKAATGFVPGQAPAERAGK